MIHGRVTHLVVNHDFMAVFGYGRLAVNHLPAVVQRERLAMAGQPTIIDYCLHFGQCQLLLVILYGGGAIDGIRFGVMHTGQGH
jgi:hypothetical protein